MSDAGLLERYVRHRVLWRGVVGFRIDTVRLPNGKLATREYMDHAGAVGVVPFVDAKTVAMVRQFRHPVREVTLEIPAGKLAAGEPVLPCLRRELREETGYTARRYRLLTRYWPTPAFANEVLHLYAAEGLRPGPPRPDEDEFLEPVLVPFREAVRLVLRGRIRDSKTIIALLACAQRGIGRLSA